MKPSMREGTNIRLLMILMYSSKCSHSSYEIFQKYRLTKQFNRFGSQRYLLITSNAYATNYTVTNVNKILIAVRWQITLSKSSTKI